MSAITNLKDLLSPAERARVEQRYAERTKRSGNSTKIAPEIWITAKLGVYFGWPAVEAVKKGYIESFEESKEGQGFDRVLVPFTLEEALMLIDAADTVHNQMTARNQAASYYATSAALSEKGFEAFAQDNSKRATAELED